jgi:cytochrome oxidase assembly protein ShyY1
MPTIFQIKHTAFPISHGWSWLNQMNMVLVNRGVLLDELSSNRSKNRKQISNVGIIGIADFSKVMVSFEGVT